MIDLTQKCKSSFLSCEKDTEEILYKLFIKSRQYSESLKRLLLIPNKDCLSNTENEEYKKIVAQADLKYLRENGYLKLEPKIRMPEHEDKKSYIIMSFDNFTPSGNPEFRDCIVTFDIICHIDTWDIGNYQLRPLKICGYIDGLLEKTRLSGIGTFQFMGCSELILNQDLAGYTLMYAAVHGSDDLIERDGPIPERIYK